MKKKKSVLLPIIHWVRGGDEGLDYCPECVEIAMKEAREADPKNAKEIVVDGGYDLFESDSPAMCDRCGQALACDVIDGPTIFTEEEWLKAD